VKSRSDWYSLHWSGAELYRLLLSMNRESVPLPVFAVFQHFKQFYCRQLKNGQLGEMSSKESEM